MRAEIFRAFEESTVRYFPDVIRGVPEPEFVEAASGEAPERDSQRPCNNVVCQLVGHHVPSCKAEAQS